MTNSERPALLLPIRIALAVLVGLSVGFGIKAYDQARGAEWVVSAEQIAEAQARGKRGFEVKPGTITVRPIRSETADLLPYKWAGYGLVAGLFVLVMTRRKRR